MRNYHGLRDITFRNQLPELGAVYASRMLYSLSRRGDAPAVMGKSTAVKPRTWRCYSPPARHSYGGGELLRACEGI